MKNEKGITLTSLVIMIIVLIILASIATYSGIGTIRYTNYNKAKAEMQIMQANVNAWYDEYNKLGTDGEKNDYIEGFGTSTSDCDQTKLNNTIQDIQEKGYTATAGDFRFLSAEFLKNKLGTDFAYDYLVNIPERQVILFNGVLYNGEKYYTAEDFGLLNISYNELNSINFDVAQGDYEEFFIYNLRFVDNQNNEFDVSKFRVLISEHESNSWKDVTNNITKTTYNDGKAYYLNNLEYKSYDIKVSTLDNKSNQKPITLIEPRAIFKTGKDVNAKMKQLAGTEGATYETEDTNILEIKRATKEQYDENTDNAEVISTSEQEGSNTPIYMWFDDNNKIIYYYTKDLTPELNPDSSQLFRKCKEVTDIEVSSLDTSNVTTMTKMFDQCNKLTNLDVSKFNTANVTNTEAMFAGCSQLEKLNVSGFNTSKVKYMSYMFQNCSSLTELDVSGFDTSNVQAMYATFFNCCNLTELDVSNFDIGKVANMQSTFRQCSKLKKLNVSNFETKNVKDFTYTFCDCSSLTYLDVSGFNTENATSMFNMFGGCSNLREINVSGFNTSNVKSFYCMFSRCESLSSIDVTNFDTSKATTLYGMFTYCSNLTEIDLSSFKTNGITDMYATFNGCTNLKKIYVSSLFDTTNVESSRIMFGGCQSLIGGSGTTFNSAYTDVTYAHIDGGESNPGYFTAKPNT